MGLFPLTCSGFAGFASEFKQPRSQGLFFLPFSLQKGGRETLGAKLNRLDQKKTNKQKQNTFTGQTMNWLGNAKNLVNRHARYIMVSASCKKERNCLDGICPTSANTPYCALRTSATVNRSYTLSESATVLRLSAAFSGP